MQGYYDEGAWRANQNHMLDSLTSPGIKSVFDQRKAWLDDRFVEYVEREFNSHSRKAAMLYLD